MSGIYDSREKVDESVPKVALSYADCPAPSTSLPTASGAFREPLPAPSAPSRIPRRALDEQTAETKPAACGKVKRLCLKLKEFRFGMNMHAHAATLIKSQRRHPRRLHEAAAPHAEPDLDRLHLVGHRDDLPNLVYAEEPWMRDFYLGLNACAVLDRLDVARRAADVAEPEPDGLSVLSQGHRRDLHQQPARVPVHPPQRNQGELVDIVRVLIGVPLEGFLNLAGC